jgi:hypothetical protein
MSSTNYDYLTLWHPQFGWGAEVPKLVVSRSAVSATLGLTPQKIMAAGWKFVPVTIKVPGPTYHATDVMLSRLREQLLVKDSRELESAVHDAVTTIETHLAGGRVDGMLMPMEVVKKLHGILVGVYDDGPPGAGWKSPELSEIVGALERALDGAKKLDAARPQE